MAELITRLKLANSEFNSGIDSSKKKVAELQETADSTGKSLKEMGDKGTKSAEEMLSEMGQFEKGARSVSNYKRQLAQLQKQIVDLTVNYRSMSAEMQQSAKGMEVKALLDEATKQAGMYKDAIQDVQQEITKLASDTAAWDSMKQGIDVVSSSLQAFVAAGVLGEESTEKLVAVIAKLKAAEAATNAVIKVGNALQKQSALMLGITKIQTIALTKAKALETTATKGATLAQKAFNLVASANPYVLLAAAVIAVGAALFAFAKKQKEATDAEKKHQEALENEKKAAEEWASKVGNATGSVLSKYKLLQIEWSKLQTTSQKKKWISDNKNEFEQLGLKVNDVTSAEATFVGNTSAVVEALKKRALAAAKQAQLTELYSQLIEAQTRAESEYAKKSVKFGDKYFGDINERNRHMFTTDNNGKWVYNDVGAAEENKKIKRQVYAATEVIQSQIDALAADIAGSIDLSTIFKPSGGGNNNNAIAAEVGSLQEAQNQVNKLQTLLNNMSPDNPKFEQTKQLLFDAQKNVERIKELLKETEPSKKLELVPNSLEEASYFVQAFSKELQKIDPNTDEFAEVLELLNIWKKRQEEINNLINSTGTETKSVVDKYKEIVSKASDINLQFSIGAIDENSAQSMIDDLNKKLSELGLTAKVKLEVDESSVKTTTQKLTDFVSTMDKVGSIGNAVNAINSVYDSIKNLGTTISEAESGWEAFFAVFQTGMTIFNAVASIIEVVATVTELLTAAKTANAAATAAETTATVSDTAAATAATGAKLGEAAATGALAATEGGASVAKIPYVGGFIAVGIIAAILASVVAAIAAASKFETGGVVGGNSYHGDKILARLNSGELILNQKQQNKLWTMISSDKNETNNNMGQVTFKVHGTDLVGCLNNYSKKRSNV